MGLETFKLAIVGRSNAGKSTLVAVLIADKKLGNSLYKGNEKGKTKLNTKYCLHKDEIETRFEIKQNKSLVEYYFRDIDWLIDDDKNTLDKALKKLKKDLNKIIPHINDISSELSWDELSSKVNQLVEIFLDSLRNLTLEELMELSEEKPILRNLIELVTVHTKASLAAQNMMKQYNCKVIEVIDTKGFGDKSELIEYEFPQIDAVIFMISDRYIDSDYITMKAVIKDQIRKVPTILCARTQKLRIQEIEEVMAADDIIECIEEFSDAFNSEDTPACILRRYLYESNILTKRSNCQKSIMELCFNEQDIFRSIPYIFKSGEKSGRLIVTDDIVDKSQAIYDKVIIDIISKAISAKIQEDTAVNDLIQKLSTADDLNKITQSMIYKCEKYIIEASTAVGINESLQRMYFGKMVKSLAKFINTIHRYIHGPRGGTTGYYAYNYDRLAIASYVCLEKGFEDMLNNGVEYLKPIEIELITRKVRRDICKYGKLAGQSEEYIAYIDYNRLCRAYDIERYGNEKENPWKGNFENYEYAYPKIREEIDSSSRIYCKSTEFKHACSIYYGVIHRTVVDAINEVLGAMPNEIYQFVEN